MANTYTFTQITGGSSKFKVNSGPSHIIEDSDWLDQLSSTVIRMQGHNGTFDIDVTVDTVIAGGTTYAAGSNIDTVYDALNPFFKKANVGTGTTVSGISDVPGLTAALSGKASTSSVDANTIKLASYPSPYLGVVATRCRISLSKYGVATGQWIQYRSMHWTRNRVTALTVVIPHFYVSTTNVETLVSGGTTKLSVEYPSGTFTLANECIANSNNAISNGTGFTVFTFNVTIPNNAQFWVRGLEVNDNGPAYGGYPNGQYNQPVSEGFESGTSAPTDKTMSGTIAAGGGFSKAPVLILAQIVQPAVLLIGDSRSVGGNEGTYDQTGDVGEVARSIGPFCGYCNFGISSSTLSTYLSASRTYRDQIVNGTITGINTGVSYFSHIICAHGFNDLSGGTAASVATSRASLASLYSSIPVIGTTITPNTSSTDGWSTLSGQTQTTGQAKIFQFNDLVRAGIVGEKFFFDIAAAVDPYRLGKWPVSRNPNDTVRATSCTFTGAISGTTLTVSAVTSGTLSLGDPITDSLTAFPGTAASTIITAFGTGTGGVGTYTVNNNQSKTSRTLYVGGFSTVDGTHMSGQLSEMIRDSGAVKVALIKR
jgi:hypothetical protein